MSLPPSVLQAMHKAFLDYRYPDSPLKSPTAEERMNAAIQALEDAGYCVKKDPVTIQELQAEIGRLQSILHHKVAGDPNKCVSGTAIDPSFRSRP